MKKYLFILISIFSITIQAQVVNIPDANFKKYLLENPEININGDDEIQVTEAKGFKGVMYCLGRDISDLTGISAFTGVFTLDCSANNLTSLDVSNNTALSTLVCLDNDLDELDVSNNTGLEKLECSMNNLTSLDVSQNKALRLLSCYDNKISDLDLSQNTSLTLLKCSNNQLSSLNVANGNNNNFKSNQNFVPAFDAKYNPNLECIKIDDGFMPTESWVKDDITSWSNDVFYCAPNGVDDLHSSENINIYPNPAVDFITIKLSDDIQNRELKILNLSGKIVMKKIILGKSTKIDLSQLDKGMYFLKVAGITKKLIFI